MSASVESLCLMHPVVKRGPASPKNAEGSVLLKAALRGQKAEGSVLLDPFQGVVVQGCDTSSGAEGSIPLDYKSHQGQRL